MEESLENSDKIKEIILFRILILKNIKEFSFKKRLGDWARSDAGQYIMKHIEGDLKINRQENHSLQYDEYTVIANLKEKRCIEYYLKFNHA